MSIVKRFEIQCDKCRCRREWTMECVANSCGVTKGNGTSELRKQARQAGWEHRQIRPKVWIDLCYTCSRYESPKAVWFDSLAANK